jgi:hypothetical protein
MLTRESLGTFKAALSEALRTTDQHDPSLRQRFVEPTPGTIDTLQTSVNQLLTGRRGVGKSTTFAVLQQEAESNGRRVIFVDVESHKGRAYPDVVIDLILDMLRALRPVWSLKSRPRSIRKRVRQLELILRELHDAGPEVTSENERSSETSRQREISLSATATKQFLSLSGGLGRGSAKSSTSRLTTSFTRRKEDFLRDLAAPLASTFSDAAALSASGSMLVVLDDFYMIDRQNQPLVLDHLHGITKRAPVWLKIASVKSRTQTFVNGDPPLGMQPPGDVHPMSLDIGLEKFPSSKTFLEEVARGILKPKGFDLAEVLTATARERAVLVAGGAVCRDYFDVLIAAADIAWNASQASDPPKLQFRIDAENIHAAAGELFDRKLTELRADAGLDAPALEARFEDILKFVRDRDTFFLLVRRDELELNWGKDIQQLEDLRFLHRIMTTRPNTGSWRGVDTVVYMVDIPALVKNRMRKAPIEFWKPGEIDKLRRATWIYDSAWQSIGKAQRMSDFVTDDSQLVFEVDAPASPEAEVQGEGN